MKVRVNEDACIGCGACVACCEDVFEINVEGLSEVKVDVVPEEFVKQTKEAIESCPTEAIGEVTEEGNE